MRDAEPHLARAAGSFSFGAVCGSQDSPTMPRAGASGLFPTASSVPCGAGDYSMPPAQSPLWRAHSQGPMVGACPGGSFSFLPGLLPHHASAEMQRGEQPRPQGPVAAAAGGFLQSSLRSGSRGAVSSSMPDLLTGVDADRSRSMRGARSTWDFDDMDAVSSEDERASNSSDDQENDEPDHEMVDSARELVPTNCTSSPRYIRASQDNTPPRTRLSASGPDICCSPGETGGLLYIQSPLNRAGKTASPVPIRTLHSIFHPRGTKVLHLIRHGESTYNAACGAPGSSWEDPNIFDAKLTDLGVRQASAVGRKLIGIPDTALWVTSPLTRAIQTCMLARSGRDGATPTEPWLTLRPELAEHLVTTGDVGRPRSLLQREFPDVRQDLEQLEELWWFQGSSGRNCAVNFRLGQRETKQEFKHRVDLFRRWVLSRPEKDFVVFGHSTFFKHLMGGDRRLANCEVYTFSL